MRIDIYRVGVCAHAYRARRCLTLPASKFPGTLDPPVTWRWRIHRAYSEIRNSARTISRHIRTREWRNLRNTLMGWRAEPDPFPQTGLVGIGYGFTRKGALIRLGRRLRDAERRQSSPAHLELLLLVVKHMGEKTPR